MTTTPPAPTITNFTTATPCPHKDVLVATMPADAKLVTVWRVVAGVSTPVRGAVKHVVAGDFLVSDYEAPFGVAVYYNCQTWDVSNIPSAVSAASASTSLAVTAAWLQDPLDPANSLAVSVTKAGGDPWLTAANSFTYGINATVVEVIGTALPVGMAGARQSAGSVPLVITSKLAAGATALRALVGAVWPLCLRVPSPSVPQLPPTAYLGDSGWNETYDQYTQLTTWSATVQSVLGPGVAILTPVRTWATLATEAATWNAGHALYGSWLLATQG